MIAVEDRIIEGNKTSFCEGFLKISTERNKGERPADLKLNFAGREIIEPDFSGLRFDGKSKQLMPFVEVGQWQDLTLVMGLRKWLIFSNSPFSLLGGLNLHREQGDDTGFYQVKLHSHNTQLVAVYEGGVVVLSMKGEIKWHKEKHWDDEFLRIEGELLIFLTETGRRFAFDCDSGDDVVID